MIVALEGCNCSGKTTVMQAIMKATNGSLRGKDIKLATIKDEVAKYPELHQTLLTRRTFEFNDVQLLQMVSAHIENIKNNIARSQADNSIIILDRTVPSYYVYQSTGDMVDIAVLLYRNILKVYEKQLRCIYLAPGIDVVKQRLINRGDANHLVEKMEPIYNRYEYYFQYEYTGVVETIRCSHLDTIVDKVILFLRSNSDAVS